MTPRPAPPGPTSATRNTGVRPNNLQPQFLQCLTRRAWILRQVNVRVRLNPCLDTFFKFGRDFVVGLLDWCSSITRNLLVQGINFIHYNFCSRAIPHYFLLRYLRDRRLRVRRPPRAPGYAARMSAFKDPKKVEAG